MSFFDDDDFDEPTHVAQEAPRRRTSGGGGGGGVGRPDPQTARTRQLVALGTIVLVLILLTVAVSSCVKSGRKNALRDYSRDVSALLEESRQEVGAPLFTALAAGNQGTSLQTRINTLRDRASSLSDRAEKLSPPGTDRGRAAQHDLELALNLRTEAVGRIADQVPAALGDAAQSEAAVGRIAGQMQALLASDVVVSQRTAPLIDQEQRESDLSGVSIQAPRFLTDLRWLQTQTVATNIGGSAGGSSSGGADAGQVQDRSDQTPSEQGTHGTSLGGVTIAGTTLTAGTPADVTGREIKVSVVNSGELDESQVQVGATFSVSGEQPVGAKTTLPSIATGATTEATIRLPSSVPTGQEGQLKIDIGGVPGEENTDNNTGTFQVTFGG